MRRTVRAALVLALTIPLLVPLLRAGWIQSHEGLSYPKRLVEVARCWDDGFWSARWFPDLNFGQGYPFLCFYAPLVFILSGLAHAAGAPVDLALKTPIVLAAIAGSAGAYRLVRTVAGPAGGVAAAALYTYAPYHVRDIYIRGDLAEFLAMGFLPWSLFAVVRLARNRSARDVALVAAAASLSILSHNILGMLTGGTLVLAALTAMASSDRPLAAGTAAAIGGIGALLSTAFFWVPALWEKQFVHIDILKGGHGVVEENFAPFLDFFRPGETPGIGQALPMTFEIGYAGIGAALLAALAWREGGRRRRCMLLLAASLVAVGIVMATAVGAAIYQALPLLRFVQLPWRFLALISLGIALLGGIGLDALLARAGPRTRAVATAAFVAVVVASVWPLLGPKQNLPLPPWSVDPAEYRRTRETTTGGEYLPIWAPSRDEPRGFDRGVRVEGAARVVAAERGVGRWALSVEADETAKVALVDLYYPGWRAQALGEAIELGPREGTGHVELTVGPGRHDIVVRLEPTQPRAWARRISLAALAIGLLAVGWRRRRP